MDEVCKNVSETAKTKNVLPDVIHSDQTTHVEDIPEDNQLKLKPNEHIEENIKHFGDKNEELSTTESISEHIPSEKENSITESNNHLSQSLGITETYVESQKKSLYNEPLSKDDYQDSFAKSNEFSLPQSRNDTENELRISLKDISAAPSPINSSNVEPSQQSWNQSDVHISEESPVVLAVSSDTSSKNAEKLSVSPNVSGTPSVTPRSEYLDSLNEPAAVDIDNYGGESKDNKSLERCSSSSEDIIKLDIRGQNAPKLRYESAKIIFGPPPNNSYIIGPCNESIPDFENLISPCLVHAGESIIISEVLDEDQLSPHEEYSSDKSTSPPIYEGQQDVFVKGMSIQSSTKSKSDSKDQHISPHKSYPPDENISFTTMSTDYRTICEDCNLKLLPFEEAITNRDRLIEELKVSLQRSGHDLKNLKYENEHLTIEIQKFQRGERSNSDHDNVKENLSDFIKYESMLKDDSTKFYSAQLSGSTSLQSSNGEKDMDREEITVNYSKSDVRISESSDRLSNEIEVLLNQFTGKLEENMLTDLKKSLLHMLSEKNAKLKMEYEESINNLEIKINDKDVEIHALKEMKCTKKELEIKYEKELNILRKYYEDIIAKSYSEDVQRSRTCASPAGEDVGAGDARPQPRSLTIEFSGMPELEKQARKYEQQIEEAKMEHIDYVNDMQARHKEEVLYLEEQISHLKAQIQTAENTAASEYPQDIDLELEKEEERQRAHDDQIRNETVTQLVLQLQVLLSDPDADASSWPPELVVLRDKIHGDALAAKEGREGSSLREEPPGEIDKWRQRRNNSFDQNRQLEEIKKERDELRRQTVSLRHVVAQLVAYCASAEDEVNRTVLAHLLTNFVPNDDTFENDSQLCSPNVSGVNTSLISRGKHVHFAPDLHSILMSLDEDGGVDFLQHERDISADIKKELEYSLKRLRNEAHELLELSARLAINRGRQDSKMIESSPVTITELVREMDDKRRFCDNCNLQQKNMEEAMSECLQRENALRQERDDANMRLAQLLAADERAPADVIEGYGVGDGEIGGMLGGSRSLESGRSPRDQLARMARELELLQKERDDLEKQLEVATLQLRSTKQFIAEQIEEREAERDQHAESVRELRDLREENTRLTNRLESNARILAEMGKDRLRVSQNKFVVQHVDQLESQIREMNQIIDQLETHKHAAAEKLKASKEETVIVRDIVADLEAQLKQKKSREAEVLEQLAEMKRTIDERDNKVRTLLGELESLQSEKAEQTDFMCTTCNNDEEKQAEFVEKVKKEAEWVAQWVTRRRQRLERAYEHISPPNSDLTEDVSLPDRRPLLQSPEVEAEETMGQYPGTLSEVWEALQAHARAADAALKRIDDLEMQRAALRDLAQEVRAERDVLQARMSEQALRISSLSARLQQQRNDAEALAHAAASQLSVQLHDTHAEVQRLKEELESKDKQLARLKHSAEERDAGGENQQTLYRNQCTPKDKLVILEKELSNAQAKIAQLEELARSLEKDKEKLKNNVKEHQRILAEKEDQLNEIMALKLNDEEQNQQSENIEAKASARTLSDIVSISEFDEDLQMRRAELKNNSMSFIADDKDRSNFNKTLPPEAQQPNMSSLHAESVHHFDFKDLTPHADSLPAYLTSTRNRDAIKWNVQDITENGSAKKVVDSLKLSQSIPDNCSIFPNRNISDSKNISVEPKKINFSLEPSDNKTHDDDDFPSCEELPLDVKLKNYPDILIKQKQQIKKYKSELEICRSELKNAEEQLCEFPALKEEVEKLKSLLDNTVATMENDKKFYENQLESFSSNKKLLEQRLTELARETGEKSKDLHLLKEDILRRENMILELAKEKRNLTNKIQDLEKKIDELQSKNIALEKYEVENKQMKEKLDELQKLEQLVSEKNQQIDSLNQHLDRLDDLQRCLNDKNEELNNLKEALQEKSNELFQMQVSANTLSNDITKVVDENNLLNFENKEIKIKLAKLEKEQQNLLTKQQNSDNEIDRLKSLNNEFSSKINELKQLNENIKEKDTEIEILHRDIDVYHNEIAALKEQLKMISRSPSPKSKAGEERTPDRQASNDKKQLVRIKKQISLLQHELDFNKKDLNDKAFELAKAKLDLTELKSNLSQATKDISEKDANNIDLQQITQNMQSEIKKLKEEKQHLSEQFGVVAARLREETNVAELKEKLRQKVERCQELEIQLLDMRELVDSRKLVPASQARPQSRSPTAELERAVRDQLHYSHALDDDMMEHILSASSDEREDIPRLALNTSRSSSVHSSSSERVNRLRSDNEKLEMQVNNLECRLSDKDALIAELNRVRDQLTSELQCAQLRYEAEKDNSARLTLLLDSQKESSETLRQQDTSVIELLQRRLESAMRSEAELQQRERALQRQSRRAPAPGADVMRAEMESEQLRSSVSVLQSKMELERRRNSELQAQLEAARVQAQRDAHARDAALAALRDELAELRRLKRESCAELARCRELLHARAAAHHNALAEIENYNKLSPRRRTELESAEVTPLKVAVRPTNEEKEQAIRYLHGRCLLLESYRKALAWQKRYLQSKLAGYEKLELQLLPAPTQSSTLRGSKRFKSVAWCAVAALRMRYVAARRSRQRQLSSECLLRSRDQGQSPLSTIPRDVGSWSAVRSLRRDARFAPPSPSSPAHCSSPKFSGDLPRTPYSAQMPFAAQTHTPRPEPFVLSSPHGDSGGRSKMEVVSRCLSRAMDAGRDVP